MKSIIVIPNIQKDSELNITKKVIKKLCELDLCVYVEEKHSSDLTNINVYREPPRDAELIVVIGGDGSVIDASCLAVELDIPLLGINLGKVGYLATVDPEDIDLLSRVATEEFNTTDKMLLLVEKHSADGNKTLSSRLALNDVVISHESYLGISNFKVENACGDHVQYRADGVIISTPAGSTAYALSAGGPIISHTLDSIMVTPICPHSFFNRAIVYGPEEEIRITNVTDTKMNVSLDGRFFSSLENGDYCVITKSEKRFKMINFGKSNIFSSLSKKIKLLHDSI